MLFEITSRSSRMARWLLVLAGLSQLPFVGAARAQGNAAVELTLPQSIDLALKQNRQIQLA